MTNERIIFNEVCTHYDALQRHDLVSRFYTAEQVERYTAGLKFEPDGNGNTPDPVEAAEAFLCSKLFHTWAEWHKEMSRASPSACLTASPKKAHKRTQTIPESSSSAMLPRTKTTHKEQYPAGRTARRVFLCSFFIIPGIRVVFPRRFQILRKFCTYAQSRLA